MKKLILLPLLLGAVVLSGCGAQPKAEENAAPLVAVKTQLAAQSRTLKQDLEFPAQVLGDQEAKVYAKANGTVTGLGYKVGDQVRLGDLLVTVDDATPGQSGSNLNANQIKQAQIAAQQAAAAYQMARTSYTNLLQSASRDLKQGEISRDQAQTGQENLGITTAEALKSAQLAYDTAKISVEQARLALDNREKLIGQNESDTSRNAELTANSAVDSSRVIALSLNSMLELDRTDDGLLPYHRYLGLTDSGSLNRADMAYVAALKALDDYRSATFSDATARTKAAADAVGLTKKLVDESKNVLDHTLASAYLPQTSVTGPSLSSFTQTVAGYQTQINGLLTQITSMNQALTNLPLNNTATLDTLKKTYELAQQQERIALQSLENLKAGNKAQQDQASYGATAAGNAYESLKSKIDTQLAVAKTQVDTAELQYRNAVVSLDSLMDTRRLIAPIDGTVTRLAVALGDTVSAGQLVAVVSTPDRIKLQFFVDQDTLKMIATGQAAALHDNSGHSASGTVYAITQQADPVTRRYMVEVRPDQQTQDFALGSIATVVLPVTKNAQPGAYLIPLAALEVGQSSNSIFLVGAEDKIESKEVKIQNVEGEYAEISAELSDDARVVVDGNKLVKQGDKVTIQN